MKVINEDANDLNVAMLPLEEYTEKWELDFWKANDETIVINTTRDLHIKELKIITHNFNTIIFSEKYQIKIDHLKLCCDGIKLDTPKNIEITNCSIYTTRPEITFTDFTANKLNIEYEINEDMEQVRNLLTGVAIIPGGGEFVLDPNYSHNKKAFESLNELKETFPNIKWIAPVVTWFANSLNVKECEIKPGADKYYKYPTHWQVSSYSSTTLDKNPPHFIKTKNESSIYGGTTNDQSLVEYLEYAKTLDLKIMLNPLIMVNQDDKPWRGWIGKDSNAKDIESFYENHYKPFILHYANLVKGKVNAFIIGSELVGLTSLHDENGEFPFIEKLLNLAKLVKEILGPNVKITYAANWTEYRTVDGFLRPLDKLWASDDIDVVGIDAYFPLTHSEESSFELEDLRKGWTTGEGIDFYFNGGEKVNFKKEEGWNQWKNLNYWWDNDHWVHDKTTAWKPRMKPIWFTEFGCPSIDKAPNKTSAFYNPECKDGDIPPFSNSKVDHAIQLRTLRTTLEQWNGSEVENLLCWAWDTRGFGWQEDPYFTDGNLWNFGHWIDGKIKVPEHKIVLKGKITLNGEKRALTIRAKIVEISAKISAEVLELNDENIALNGAEFIIMKDFELKAIEGSIIDSKLTCPAILLETENNLNVSRTNFNNTELGLISNKTISLEDVVSDSDLLVINSPVITFTSSKFSTVSNEISGTLVMRNSQIINKEI